MPDKETIQKPFHQQIEDRQEAYIAMLSQGFGKREAAKKAGFPQRMSERSRKLIETPELRRRIQRRLLADHGMDRMANSLIGAMTATLPMTDKNSGEIVPSAMPDHKAQVNAVKVAAELMGMTERQPANLAAMNVVINLPSSMGDRYAQSLDVPRGTLIDAEPSDPHA